MREHLVTVEERDPVVADLGFGRPVTLESGGWFAECRCGWGGNNPHPSRDDAEEARLYHLETAAVEDERAAALDELAAAATDDAREAALAAYNRPGALK